MRKNRRGGGGKEGMEEENEDYNGRQKNTQE